ncbi:MAG: type II secretion system protein [Phycisphaerae bacterium]
MKRAKNRGFALIAITIAVLIIVMLYMINLTSMFGPIDKNRAYEERPWFEEQRLFGKEAFPIIQTGKKGKVVINEQVILKGIVHRKDKSRGELQIVIEPNGLAKGRWQCKYEYTDSSYAVSADFKGNIDPTKIYQNETGKNPQLLYLIAKGQYEQIKTDKKTGNQWPLKQTIYVVGWLDEDFSAKGKLFLMADSDEYAHGNAEYNWQTTPNAEDN